MMMNVKHWKFAIDWRRFSRTILKSVKTRVANICRYLEKKKIDYLSLLKVPVSKHSIDLVLFLTDQIDSLFLAVFGDF